MSTATLPTGRPAAPAAVDRDDRPAAAPKVRRRGIDRAVLLVVWMYLTAQLCLAAWVVVPALALGWDPHVITSGSMTPKIRVGEVVLATPPPSQELETGTIVVFDDPEGGGLITHRIVGIEDDGSYRTQGDANPTPDPRPLPASEVEGVGRLLVPMIGLPAAWLRNGDTFKFIAWATMTITALAIAPATAVERRLARKDRTS